MTKYNDAEQSAAAFLEAAGVDRRQHCTHLVAALYARLAVNADDSTVRPSVDYVAEKLGYSTRQVKRANARLDLIGFVQTIGRYARRAIRAVASLAKGDTASRSKVTRRPVTSSAPLISLKSRGKPRSDRPTPAPPAYVPDARSAPVARPEVRERLRTGWRDLANA